jgi:hypothetical protein
LQKIYELRLAQARLGGAIDRLPRRGQRPPVVAQDATAE